MRRRESAGITAGAVLALAVLVALLAHPARAEEGTVPSDDLMDRARTILTNHRDARLGDPEATVTALAALGPEVGPILLGLRNEFPGSAHVAAIAETLVRLRHDKLGAYLLAVAEWSEDPSPRITAYLKLAKHGGPAELPHLLRLMARNRPEEKRVSERALTAILRRNESRSVYGVVQRSLPGPNREFGCRVVCCVGSAGSRLGLDLLGALLGSDPGLDHAVISGIAHLPVTTKDADLLAKLRSYVGSPDSNLRREVALALGIFRVTDAVLTLIDLLSDENPGVRGNAHWSLRAISDADLPPDPDRWRQWYDRECGWWRGEGQRYVALLESEDEAVVLDAMRMLSSRPLFRHEVATKLEPLLASSPDRVRALAGETIARASFTGASPTPAPRRTGSIIRIGRAAPKKKAPPLGTSPLPPEEMDEGMSNLTLALIIIVLCLIGYATGILHPDRIRGLLQRS